MENGYRILWTDNALVELKQTIDYLEQNWSAKEINKLAVTIEYTLQLISKNPYIFQVSDVKKDVRRAVILSVNTLYYRVKSKDIEIVSFFQIGKTRKKEDSNNRNLKSHYFDFQFQRIQFIKQF
jgi:plasmid stabilization system protein ParE